MPGSDRALLQGLFARAVAVADPMERVPAALPPRPPGRVIVIGAGKASARMAEAVELAWGPCDGVVITRYGYGRPTAGIEIVEAAHPVPDAAGARATARILDLLAGLGPDDFVLGLISGGGSALLVQPVPGVTLAEKQAVNAALLASGAQIGRINLVRKHLSRVKGGQLAAAAYPARLLTLMISDVPGDDPADIASGPTVGEARSQAEARSVLAEFGIDPPARIRRALAGQTPVRHPTDPDLSRVENRIIAAPAQSLAAAAKMAEAAGLTWDILGDALEGEARDLARAHAKIALSHQAALKKTARPHLLLSGGECTVTQKGTGIGGPNAEYALALAIALDGAAGITALAADTDGIDGAAEIAGACIDPTTLARAKGDPGAALSANDAHSFFAQCGDQVITGPTLTNVNDFRAILIRPPQ